MKRIYSEKDIKERMKSMTIICDSRENQNGHITGYLDARKLPYISRKLCSGDYSFQIGNTSFEDEITIERKANLDEIAGNLTADRLRFENEFLRAKANGVKVFLVIENGSWEKINAHAYRSRMEPKALSASLLSWQVKYGLTVCFCEQSESAELIYGTLYYWGRERMK